MSKTQTKQQKYANKLHTLGFKGTEVVVHADDITIIRDFARMLREKRGYGRREKINS